MDSASRNAGRLAGAAGLLLFAVATGVALSKHPLPLTLVLAFGVGLLGTLALALARYDAAVGLGIRNTLWTTWLACTTHRW